MERRLGPWLAAIAAILVAGVYHVGTLSEGQPVLLNLDDGYIHASLGENLARSGTLGLNPGEAGGGSSSLVWSASISAAVALGLRGDAAAGVLSLLGLALAVAITSCLAFDVLARSRAWCVTGVVALTGQTVALGLSGMESLLFGALVVGGLRDAALVRRWSGTPWFCLAGLVRIEAGLAALACASVWTLSRDERLRRVLGASCVFVTTALGTGVLAALGHGLPSTLAARRWLYGMGQSPIPGVEQWTGVIPHLVNDLLLRSRAYLGPGGAIGWAWTGLVILLGVAGLVVALRSPKLSHVALYLIAQLAFVILVLGSDGQMSRYLVPLWLLSPLIVALGWEAWLERLGRNPSRALCVALLVLYGPQLARWGRWHAGAVNHLRHVHLAMTERVATMLPPTATVAAFDVGLAAYRGGRRVADMGGLSDAALLEAMLGREMPRALARRGVRYAVFPEARRPDSARIYADRLGFTPGSLGAPLARTALGPEELGHLGPTKVAMPALALYDLGR